MRIMTIAASIQFMLQVLKESKIIYFISIRKQTAKAGHLDHV